MPVLLVRLRTVDIYQELCDLCAAIVEARPSGRDVAGLLCKRECLMFFDDAQQHPSESDTSESGIRFAMMLAELWHDWFEAMSEVAYQKGEDRG